MRRTRLHSTALRSVSGKLLTRQQLLITIGVAIYLIFLAVGNPAPVIVVLVYTLMVGNLSLPSIEALHRWLIPRRFPWNWLLFLLLLVVVSYGTQAIADFFAARWLARFGFNMPTWLSPGHSFAQRLLFLAKEPAWLFTYIVGVAFNFYANTRSTLEQRNFELQQSVRSGMTQLQKQEQELKKAREIQEGLLPKVFPKLKGFEIVGSWQPARVVSGDYFDVIRFSDKNAALCVGDVSGKGITAALLMANLQAAVRAFAAVSTSCGALCEKLNSVMCNNMASDKFVTFFYAVLDGDAQKIAYTTAGHCPPILLRRGEVLRLDSGGAVLGVFPEWEYCSAESQLQSGDQILIFTDGLTEAMNSAGEEFGEPRLIDFAKGLLAEKPAELQSRILQEVTRFCDGKFHDDATLIVVAVT
jgi:sigma-B regulation protein RsbU (phosphoserine phosphatase)